LVLIVVYVVYSRDVQANTSEQTLPAGDWVCADYRMNRSELKVFIERRPSRRHDFVSSGLTG
jgi:hypothetical protein